MRVATNAGGSTLKSTTTESNVTKKAVPSGAPARQWAAVRKTPFLRPCFDSTNTPEQTGTSPSPGTSAQIMPTLGCSSPSGSPLLIANAGLAQRNTAENSIPTTTAKTMNFLDIGFTPSTLDRAGLSSENVSPNTSINLRHHLLSTEEPGQVGRQAKTLGLPEGAAYTLTQVR